MTPFFPQGGQGFGAALQDASPLLLAMAQGLQSGQGAFAGVPQGIAQMMQTVGKRKGDQIFQDVMGGGIRTGQQMQQPGGSPSLAGVMGGGTVPQRGVPGNVNPAVAGAFPQSLIRTESGGNWQALNNEQGAGGRGHGGRLQFGTGRLQDAQRAGVIGGMTPQEFAQQPPEVQQAVEQWHFADIDRQAEQRGLTKFIGQEVGGVPITQDAIRAMAHLGGIGGAQRFLESGGRENPADANGTSLRDYAQIHGGVNQYGQPVQMEQPDPARTARLYEAMGNPNLSPEQRAAIGMRIQMEESRNQPMTPLQQVQLQAAQLQLEQARQPQQREMPAAVQELEWRASQAGLQPGTPEYQQFILTGGQGGGNASAAEQTIGRLEELGMPRQEAIRVAELYTVSRDPVTGEAIILDKSTGQQVGGQMAQQETAAQTGVPAQAPVTSTTEGLQFPAARDAFGIGGAARGAANRVADVAGVDVPFPQVQETQADFAVLREGLLNGVAESYGRQPPSWLLKEIRDLTPEAGSPLQGAGGAESKLQSLRRHFVTEGANAEAALQRRLSPTERQAAEARAAGLRNNLNMVDNALQAFGGGGQSAAPVEVQSQDQYQSLPSGTQFIAPDGTVRIKP